MRDNKELKDLEVDELTKILARGYIALEGCTPQEARSGVMDTIRKCLIEEIEWVGEMLEK